MRTRDGTKRVGQAEQHEAEGKGDANDAAAGARTINANARGNAEDRCANGEEHKEEGANRLGDQLARHVGIHAP